MRSKMRRRGTDDRSWKIPSQQSAAPNPPVFTISHSNQSSIDRSATVSNIGLDAASSELFSFF